MPSTPRLHVSQFFCGILLILLSGCIILRPHLPKSSDNSVQPLQMNGTETFCTAFSINQEKGLWVTAEHCIRFAAAQAEEDPTFTMTILGHKAIPIYADDHADVAMLQAETNIPALPLSDRAPRPYREGESHDLLEVRGFPFGISRLISTEGYLSAHFIPIEHPQFSGHTIGDILDVTGAPGNSGSPVLMNGKVVGVVWGGFTGTPYMIGVPWEELVRALGPYWGR